MLYTVSGVQLLALLNAFDDLDKRVPNGCQKIGQCAFVSLTGFGQYHNAHASQISQLCKTLPRELLQVTSGVNRTPVFFMGLSMLCR